MGVRRSCVSGAGGGGICSNVPQKMEGEKPENAQNKKPSKSPQTTGNNRRTTKRNRLVTCGGHLWEQARKQVRTQGASQGLGRAQCGVQCQAASCLARVWAIKDTLGMYFQLCKRQKGTRKWRSGDLILAGRVGGSKEVGAG